MLLSTGAVKLLNVAPEMGLDAIPVIEQATARGVVVGVGHAKPHVVNFEVEVKDAWLDIEFVHKIENPMIAAIEIELLE